MWVFGFRKSLNPEVISSAMRASHRATPFCRCCNLWKSFKSDEKDMYFSDLSAYEAKFSHGFLVCVDIHVYMIWILPHTGELECAFAGGELPCRDFT